jgi:hypothetical protein
MNIDNYQRDFKIIAPSATLEPGGALFNLALWVNVTFDVLKDSSPSGTTTYHLPDRALETSAPNFAHVQAVVASGGEVENFKCFFVIAAEDYETALVPLGFNGSFDADNMQRTWKQWVETSTYGNFYPVPLADGRYAIPCECHGYMLGSVLANLTTECEVINNFQIRTMMPVYDMDGTA